MKEKLQISFQQYRFILHICQSLKIIFIPFWNCTVIKKKKKKSLFAKNTHRFVFLISLQILFYLQNWEFSKYSILAFLLYSEGETISVLLVCSVSILFLGVYLLYLSMQSFKINAPSYQTYCIRSRILDFFFSFNFPVSLSLRLIHYPCPKTHLSPAISLALSSKLI